MVRNTRRSFSGKATLLAVLSSGVAVMVMAVVFSWIDYMELKPAAVAQAKSVAEGMSSNLIALGELTEDNEPAISAILRRLETVPFVVAAFVYDVEGRIVARYDVGRHVVRPLDAEVTFDLPELTLRHSLRADGQTIGTLQIVTDLTAAYDRVWQHVGLSVVIGLAAMLCAYVFSLRLQRAMSEPIAEIVAAARQVSTSRSYGLRATRFADDEMGELTDAFNDMLNRVEQRDVELKEAQRALGHSEERARKIIDAALDAVITLDANGIITGWNSRAEHIFGWLATEAIGKYLAELIIPPQYRQAHREGLQRYVETGVGPILNKRLQLTALRRDGQEFPVELAVTAIRVDNDIHFSGFIADITERQRTERALRDREARFRAVVDTAADGIVTINSDGIIEFANPAIERIFGYDGDELIGRNVNILMPEPDHSAHDGYLERYLRTGEAHIIGTGRDVQGRHKDGTLFPLHLSIARFELDGKTFFTGIIHDLTARKKTEEALSREQALLKTLVENAPDCIYVKDARCRLLMSNPAHMRMLGVARVEDAIGKTDFDFFSRVLAERYYADEQHLLATGQPMLNREEPVVDPDGRLRWFATSKIPILNAEGKPMRLVGISRDITELRDALERAESTNRELKHKNEEIEQFVYTVSHDLKSPIVTCVGFLGMMKEDLAAGDVSSLPDSMSRMERAINRMHESISDLLELSRLGRVRNEPVEIDMNLLLGDLADELGPRMKDAGVELLVQPGMPTIIADRNQVLEVMENLVTNAIKYGAEVQGPRIEIGSTEVDEEVRFYVRDNGPGIAPEYQKRIFGLFQRLDNKKEGTGVGLTIVNRIMELHGGRVWLESEVGKGATFWVAFPLAVMDTSQLHPSEVRNP